MKSLYEAGHVVNCCHSLSMAVTWWDLRGGCRRGSRGRGLCPGYVGLNPFILRLTYAVSVYVSM